MSNNDKTRDKTIDKHESKADVIIGDILSIYDQEPKHSEIALRDFYSAILERRNLQEEQNKLLMDAIKSDETIDEIDGYYESLRTGQMKGKSKATWLEDTFKELISAKQNKQRDQIISEVRTALADTTQSLHEDLYSQGVEEAPILGEDGSFEDINATIISDSIVGEIQNLATLSYICYANSIDVSDNDHLQGVGVAKKYFEGDLDSNGVQNLKKVLSFSTIVAKEEGLLPELGDASPVEIASMVDLGVSATKEAYDVAAGKTQTLDALDRLYDKGTAVMCTLVSWKSKVAGWAAGTKIGALTGTVFGPVGIVVGAVAGGVVGSRAGKKVGKTISKGVKSISGVAKMAVKQAWRSSKKVASNMLQRIGGLFR